MRQEGWTLGFIAIFMAVVAPVYWLMSREIIGTVVLILTFGFAAMLAVYLFI